MAWSIFRGNPSIKNLPRPPCQFLPSEESVEKVGGLLTVSRIAFSSSWTNQYEGMTVVVLCQTDLDSDFHGDDLAFCDVLLDHGSVRRSWSLLLCAEKVSSYLYQRSLAHVFTCQHTGQVLEAIVSNEVLALGTFTYSSQADNIETDKGRCPPAPGPPSTKTTVTSLWSNAGCSGVDKSDGGGSEASPVS